MAAEKYQLTEVEEMLIDRHLNFYRELASGARQPETDAQKHFVKVSQGHAKSENEHELAYAKYMRLQAIRRVAESPNEEAIPKYEEGFPRPGWSDENDWRKMKKSNYNEMKKRGRE